MTIIINHKINAKWLLNSWVLRLAAIVNESFSLLRFLTGKSLEAQCLSLLDQPVNKEWSVILTYSFNCRTAVCRAIAMISNAQNTSLNTVDDRAIELWSQRARYCPEDHFSAFFQIATLSDSDGVVASTIVATMNKPCPQLKFVFKLVFIACHYYCPEAAVETVGKNSIIHCHRMA